MLKFTEEACYSCYEEIVDHKAAVQRIWILLYPACWMSLCQELVLRMEHMGGYLKDVITGSNGR